MRPIDADKLKAHYAWWANDPDARETKKLFDAVIDQQPTVACPLRAACVQSRRCPAGADEVSPLPSPCVGHDDPGVPPAASAPCAERTQTK